MGNEGAASGGMEWLVSVDDHVVEPPNVWRDPTIVWKRPHSCGPLWSCA